MIPYAKSGAAGPSLLIRMKRPRVGLAGVGGGLCRDWDSLRGVRGVARAGVVDVDCDT